MLANKQELEDLQAKLGAILSIVEKYRSAGGVEAITHRIADFSKYAISSYLHDFPSFFAFLLASRAVTIQLEAIQALHEQSVMTRVAFVQKDADTILEASRKIISLCDVFQVSSLSI